MMTIKLGNNYGLIASLSFVAVLVLALVAVGPHLAAERVVRSPALASIKLDTEVPNELKPQVASWLRGASKGSDRRIILRYTACGGLVNQHYSHISAFLVALALKAEVVFPDACYRNSFGLHYDMDANRNKMEWFLAPAETLWDVAGIQELWKRTGIKVYKTPNRTGDPLLTRPAIAFPLYDQPEFDRRLVARLDDTYIALQPMSLLVSRARRSLEDKLRSIPKDLRASTDYVVLDMPCTFFAARTARALPLATQVARALPFSREVEALATRTVAALAVRGHVAFNGVHLRIEKDAGDWSIIMGGAGRIWHIYCETMRDAGINATLPLYVATGLLSYGATSDWDTAKHILSSKNLTSHVLTKNEFVPKFELERLNTEQLALLDLLILARSVRFVGFGSSTFSYYLTQYRSFHGAKPEDSVLVAAPQIGTDEMFQAAAVVAELPQMNLVP